MSIVKKGIIYLLPVMFIAPVLLYAQAPSPGIKGVLDVIIQIFTILIAVLITLGLIYFLWGVGKYILSGGNETERQEGRQMMIHGIIALFVMVSVWGLVAVLVSTFGLQSQNRAPVTPQVVTPGAGGTGGTGGTGASGSGCVTIGNITTCGAF